MTPNPSASNSFTVISGLAHELDSPLKSILTRTHKLIHDYKNRDFEYISYKDFKVIIATLEHMERQLKHCSQTTSRMLYVGKRQARLENNNCQINDLIKGVMVELRGQLKSNNVKIYLRLAKQLPHVAIDPIEAHQIMHNVITNAVQAMPGGGNIRIRTYLDKKGSVGMDVADEGVGIDPEHLSRIFEPFFTTKQRGVEKSSGIGLSIIHSIIHAAGGSINIKSSLRTGTTVKISLPAISK